MKKRLFSILTVFGIGLSFCNAQLFDPDEPLDPVSINTIQSTRIYLRSNTSMSAGDYNCFTTSCYDNNKIQISKDGYDTIGINDSRGQYLYCGLDSGMTITNTYTYSDYCMMYFYTLPTSTPSCPEPEPSTIDVLYNNENSTSTITCNGDNIIQIDGLSTITATNKRTPYFNIDYKDENNQSLIESYSNDILYLSGSLFKKTYTGDNDRILTTQNSNSESTFTGFIPVFDVTGSTATIDTGNMFNNFSDNALKVLLSNIPAYIQYITIFFILLFLFGFIRRFKSKR